MICSDTVEEPQGRSGEDPAVSAGRLRGACTKLSKARPVTIRFLDPPLHEFVPNKEDGNRASSPKTLGKTVEQIKNIIASLHEFNPMMGHRGCRLAVTYPGDRRDADHAPSSTPPSTSRSATPTGPSSPRS